MFNLTDTEKSVIEFTIIMSAFLIFALLIPNIVSFIEYGLDEYLNNLKNEEMLSDLEYKCEHIYEYNYENKCESYFKEINEKIVLLQEDIKHLEKTINVCTEIVQILVDREA